MGLVITQQRARVSRGGGARLRRRLNPSAASWPGNGDAARPASALQRQTACPPPLPRVAGPGIGGKREAATGARPGLVSARCCHRPAERQVEIGQPGPDIREAQSLLKGNRCEWRHPTAHTGLSPWGGGCERHPTSALVPLRLSNQLRAGVRSGREPGKTEEAPASPPPRAGGGTVLTHRRAPHPTAALSAAPRRSHGKMALSAFLPGFARKIPEGTRPPIPLYFHNT